ncbi:MAG TPA: cytochrome-c oxidase, cbb3-type subunit III [Xanthomonadales bacterium]|nr:cytochrome-c oxidase, cbb3-type subunit III [Xanthomonadales bacterium]
MNAGWSIYVALFTLVNILACLWLLWWTSRHRKPGDEQKDTTGHSWDGITEYNKPLPRWWLNLFYATIVFALGYLVVFPGLGNFAGTQKWSSDGELAAEQKAATAKRDAALARYAGKPIAELARDDSALALGRGVFANHCAACHGSDARGARGYPNLTDDDWLWGGEPERVLETVLEGRTGAMPALGTVLGPDGVADTAVYVQQLAGGPVDPAMAARGERHFRTICVACHGADGKGNAALGAPNLTDTTWLYGGDLAAITQTIRDGRNGAMPAHRPLIGESRARLAAAWVVSGAGARDAGARAAGSGAP